MHLGQGHDAAHLFIQALDDGRGRACGGQEAVPERDFHVHTEFGERGNAGVILQALARRDSQGLDPSTLQKGGGRAHVSHHHGDVTGDHGRDALGGAFVGDVGKARTGLAFEQLVHQLERGRRRGVVGFVRVLFGVGHQLLHGFSRVAGLHQNHQRRIAKQSNRREIIRAIGQLGIEHMVEHHRAGHAHDEGVAVRLGLGHIRRADDGGHAGFVLHHHRLAQTGGQFFRQDARHLIDATTSGITHHEGDRFVGVVLRAGAGHE